MTSALIGKGLEIETSKKLKSDNLRVVKVNRMLALLKQLFYKYFTANLLSQGIVIKTTE